MTSLRLGLRDGFPVIAGYTLAVNAEGGNNTLTIQRNFPIDIKSIRFKLTEDNIGDSFSLLLRSSERVGQIEAAISPDATRITLSFRSTTVFQTGWTIILTRGVASAIVGIIARVDATGAGRARRVQLIVVRNPNDPLDPIFNQTGINNIFIGVPLMSDIRIVDTNDILYCGGPGGVSLDISQELLLNYSPTDESAKTFTLYLEFCYNIN